MEREKPSRKMRCVPTLGLCVAQKRCLLEGLELFARLEANGASRRDIDLFARTRVAADACFARLDGEDAKATQLDAIAAGESTFHRAEDGIDCSLRLDPRKTCAFDNPLDEVLLDQASTPFGYGENMADCVCRRLPRW